MCEMREKATGGKRAHQAKFHERQVPGRRNSPKGVGPPRGKKRKQVLVGESCGEETIYVKKERLGGTRSRQEGGGKRRCLRESEQENE